VRCEGAVCVDLVISNKRYAVSRCVASSAHGNERSGVLASHHAKATSRLVNAGISQTCRAKFGVDPVIFVTGGRQWRAIDVKRVLKPTSTRIVYQHPSAEDVANPAPCSPRLGALPFARQRLTNARFNGCHNRLASIPCFHSLLPFPVTAARQRTISFAEGNDRLIRSTPLLDDSR
jgi:hypothetical protein